MGVIDLEENYFGKKAKQFGELEALLRDRQSALEFFCRRITILDTDKQVSDIVCKEYDKLIIAECKRIAAEYGDDGMPIN